MIFLGSSVLVPRNERAFTQSLASRQILNEAPDFLWLQCVSRKF